MSSLPQFIVVFLRVRWIEQTAPKPNAELTLFPSNNSMRIIYRTNFAKFAVRVGWKPEQIPSFSVFKDARNDSSLSHVKSRAKHNHLKCDECTRLGKLASLGFENFSEMGAVQAQINLHNEDVTRWNQLEDYWVNAAKHSPQEVNVFRFDDTITAGFPHFGHREPKKVSQLHRLEMIPWLVEDVARQKFQYCYTTKGRFRKGGNRLCSSLYYSIMSLKRSNHRARKARKLVLIGDNYSENKNNVVLDFLNELVVMGIYDEVQLLYGPVGHTHNGIDAKHKVHNVDLGRMCAGTFGEWVLHFDDAFAEADTRPTAMVLDAQWNWVRRYKRVSNPLSGFTNTAADPQQVHAWQVLKDDDGIVRLRWKQSAGLDSDFRGVDGVAGTRGFVKLHGRVSSRQSLQPIKPADRLFDVKFEKQLLGARLERCIKDHGMDGVSSWLQEAMTEQKLPLGDLQVAADYKRGRMGSTWLVGVAPKHVAMEVVENNAIEPAAIWWLPADALPPPVSVVQMELPLVRYSDPKLQAAAVVEAGGVPREAPKRKPSKRKPKAPKGRPPKKKPKANQPAAKKPKLPRKDPPVNPLPVPQSLPSQISSPVLELGASVGRFVAIHQTYDGGSEGVEVYKLASLVDGNGNPSITGRYYTPTKPCTNRGILKAKFHACLGSKGVYPIADYAMIICFDKLVHNQIPSNIQRALSDHPVFN